MGSIGTPELIVLGVLALLVFGPKRLPEIGKNVGAAIREFRRASRDLMSHFEDDPPARVRSVSRYQYDEDPYPAGTVPAYEDGYTEMTATPALEGDATPADPIPLSDEDEETPAATATPAKEASPAESERKA